MNLYHYSVEPYPALMTRRALGLSTPTGVRVSKDYLDHISFFTGPIPSKLMPLIFNEGVHPFWQAGKVLYEHIIHTDQLPDAIRYRIVESVRKTELLDKFSEEHDWTSHNPAVFAKWNALYEAKQKQWGETGNTKKGLLKAIDVVGEGIGYYFLAAKQRPDFKDGYEKYAANVPHLMLYPPIGVIGVRGVNKVTLGSDIRTTVKVI